MGCSNETDWVNMGKYYFGSGIRNFISHITYYSHMFFIAYTFKGKMHVFAGRMKIVNHWSCRTGAILQYFCPLKGLLLKERVCSQ